MSAKFISLTSDFGLKDPYVAEIKAVILTICPTASIIDVTHEVEKFSIRTGAFMLASVAPYFPKGTVHTAIVDPDVGTPRRPIIVETSQGFFVGPDNGLMMIAAEAQGIKQTRVIENKRLMLPYISNTFHGRDVFAPAAAHIANGSPLEEFGSKITDAVKPEFALVTRNRGSLEGEVLHVDDFGNIITNLPGKEIAGFEERLVQVEFPPHPPRQIKISKAYADVDPQEPLALIGSHGYLEIALNRGNAARAFSVKTGNKITLSKT